MRGPRTAIGGAGRASCAVERPPCPGFALRTSKMLMAVWLQGVDCAFLQYLGARILERAASVHLLFAFEYVIQVRGPSELGFRVRV